MEYKITTEYCGKEYEHGTITAERAFDMEYNIEIDLNFATVEENLEDLKKEIQEVVRKYAI